MIDPILVGDDGNQLHRHSGDGDNPEVLRAELREAEHEVAALGAMLTELRAQLAEAQGTAERLRAQNHEFAANADKRMAGMQSELDEFRYFWARARDVLDPERRNVGFSTNNLIVVSKLIERTEKAEAERAAMLVQLAEAQIKQESLNAAYNRSVHLALNNGQKIVDAEIERDAAVARATELESENKRLTRIITELEQELAQQDRYCTICCKDKAWDHEHFDALSAMADKE